jgi:hypothetical protein
MSLPRRTSTPKRPNCSARSALMSSAILCNRAFSQEAILYSVGWDRRRAVLNSHLG